MSLCQSLQIEYIARLVEEEMDDADKAEGIKGMIEGFGEPPADELDAAIDDVLGHWRAVKAKQDEEEEARRTKEEEEGAASDGSDSEDEQGDAGGKGEA